MWDVRQSGGRDMTQELSFNAKEFLSQPIDRRVRLCVLLADRAEQLARTSDPKLRDCYAEIARQWQLLADELTREMIRGSRPARV